MKKLSPKIKTVKKESLENFRQMENSNYQSDDLGVENIYDEISSEMIRKQSRLTKTTDNEKKIQMMKTFVFFTNWSTIEWDN